MNKMFTIQSLLIVQRTFYWSLSFGLLSNACVQCRYGEKEKIIIKLISRGRKHRNCHNDDNKKIIIIIRYKIMMATVIIIIQTTKYSRLTLMQVRNEPVKESIYIFFFFVNNIIYEHETYIRARQTDFISFDYRVNHPRDFILLYSLVYRCRIQSQGNCELASFLEATFFQG